MKVDYVLFEVHGVHNQNDIWSYDLEVEDDYQGSKDKIGEHIDVVVVHEVNEKEEDSVLIEGIDHVFVYPLIIS